VPAPTCLGHHPWAEMAVPRVRRCPVSGGAPCQAVPRVRRGSPADQGG
jgi:hypothetical protein